MRCAAVPAVARSGARIAGVVSFRGNLPTANSPGCLYEPRVAKRAHAAMASFFQERFTR